MGVDGRQNFLQAQSDFNVSRAVTGDGVHGLSDQIGLLEGNQTDAVVNGLFFPVGLLRMVQKKSSG